MQRVTHLQMLGDEVKHVRYDRGEEMNMGGGGSGFNPFGEAVSNTRCILMVDSLAVVFPEAFSPTFDNVVYMLISLWN